MAEQETLRDVLAYEPVASRFGTSGVRALVKDLTDMEVYCLTLGTVRYLVKSSKLVCAGAESSQPKVPLAGDLRPSTERLLLATVKAIQDAGYEVDFAGRIPTPALTFYGLVSGVASFVITGSHIPADRNGQKANRCDGEVLKSDEAGIVAAVQKERDHAYQRPVAESLFNAYGMFKTDRLPSLPATNEAVRELYVSRYRAVFPANALEGLRVLFFQYTAVGRDLIPEILENAGAQVIRAGRSNTFVPIDTEAISQDHLDMLASLVREQQKTHGPIDVVVSTDGDSDRPLLIAVDQNGEADAVSLKFFPGDLLGAVVADYLEADSVSVPISVNPAVHEFFAAKGFATQKTKIGSPYVIQAMRSALDKDKRRIVAWEANGGFLLGSDLDLNGEQLKALPTRDAVLPILCALHAAARQQSGLAQLFAKLPQWFGRAALIDDFPQETSRKIIDYFASPTPGVEWIDFEGERIVLRDNDERIVASLEEGAQQSAELRAKKRLLEEVFSSDKGFGEIERVNVLDGIRSYFSNGEIAHIRPSGNAPQLRIYAYAHSQARADEIANMGVTEPDGLLRALQELIDSLS